MAFFHTITTERPRSGHPRCNLVGFSSVSGLEKVQTALVDAADIIQSRFHYKNFLLEACSELSTADLEAVDDVFELALESNLFCVPFDARPKLPDADYLMTDFGTYCELFAALSGESDVDIDGVWEKCYAERGLLTFRLVLQ